mgnify:CR=1 FL=1
MPRGDGVRLSLFPFMSVLACTIGVLTLLLLSLSLTSVGGSRLAQDATGPFEEEMPLEAEAVRVDERAAAELARLEQERERLRQVAARWAKLDRQLEARGLPAGRELEAIRRAIDRREVRAQRSDELDRIESRLAELRSEREGIEASIEALESRRKTLPILIDPTGLSRDQKPYFMEADGGGLTAYRATDDLEYFIPLEQVGSHGDFARYLRRVRATPGALLVLLVRPGGVKAMERAHALARNAGIRVARMPLPGEGELDWRLLREAEAARPIEGLR